MAGSSTTTRVPLPGSLSTRSVPRYDSTIRFDSYSPIPNPPGALDWEPHASRLAADGTVGFTVGTFVFRDRAGSDVAHGSYVTIWQREAGGAWRVRFDTGRPRG